MHIGKDNAEEWLIPLMEGELSPPEQRVAEALLREDAGLARELLLLQDTRQVADTDIVFGDLGRLRRIPSAERRRRALPWRSLAAAASLALAVSLWWWTDDRPVPTEPVADTAPAPEQADARDTPAVTSVQDAARTPVTGRPEAPGLAKAASRKASATPSAGTDTPFQTPATREAGEVALQAPPSESSASHAENPGTPPTRAEKPTDEEPSVPEPTSRTERTPAPFRSDYATEVILLGEDGGFRLQTRRKTPLRTIIRHSTRILNGEGHKAPPDPYVRFAGFRIAREKE